MRLVRAADGIAHWFPNGTTHSARPAWGLEAVQRAPAPAPCRRERVEIDSPLEWRNSTARPRFIMSSAAMKSMRRCRRARPSTSSRTWTGARRLDAQLEPGRPGLPEGRSHLWRRADLTLGCCEVSGKDLSRRRARTAGLTRAETRSRRRRSADVALAAQADRCRREAEHAVEP
jgi:hypothetical protein